MTKIGYDKIKFDALQIVEDSKCCLKVNAVITKEGVYPYPDGRAYKSRMELLKATHSARAAKIIVLDHPDSLVIMSQKQINGFVEKPFFDRDKIRAQLNFDKSTCTPEFLDNVRNGKLKDVSIGFYYQPDLTPGKWNGNDYDYVMRDIVIDHVAAGVLKGRCSYPSCGIGVDTMMKRIALDPFGEYTDFADCVAKNQDKGDPEAYCATIKRQIEGSKQIMGGKKSMSEKTPEFEAFVSQYIAEGHTREQALEHWKSITQLPVEATVLPTPPPQVPPAVPPKEEEVKPKTIDQPEKTPLEKCVAEAVGAGKTEVEATDWCKAELAGEHEATDSLIDRSKKLISMREQKVIEDRRNERRHPL